MSNQYDCLKLENQLCFPLYACSKEVVKRYRPHLDAINLTYTQYIAMMVFWEHKIHSVKELGEKLYLDSGTLTPVLKSLEAKGFVKRYRSSADERVLLVELTEEGEALKEKALNLPALISNSTNLSEEEASQLQTLLAKVLSKLEEC